MVGKPFDFDKKDGSYFSVKYTHIDKILKSYLCLLPGKNILDLGIGTGKNSVYLSSHGYNVVGVDYSNKATKFLNDNYPNIKTYNIDIRHFEIEPNKFDLIMSLNVLHFLHKDDVHVIIDDIKYNLCKNGIVYISVFSLDDPKLKFIKNDFFEILDNHICHKLYDDTYVSFFSKNEILELFKDFKTLYISDEYFLDNTHGSPHFHGIIKYIGQKI